MGEQYTEITDNLGAFALVVGSVSIAFGSVFQLAIGGTVAFILNAIVVGVALVSIVIGLSLDAMGHFDDNNESEKSTETDENTERLDEVEYSGNNKPLPPVLNFDAKLQELASSYDTVPDKFTKFQNQYERLKSSEANRDTIASDLRAMVNPLVVTAPDEDAEQIAEDIGDQLFKFINESPSQLLEVEEWGLFEEGSECPVADAQGENVRIRAKVLNRGQSVNAELAVRFVSSDGVKIKNSYLPMGTVSEAETKSLDTQLYVPSLAVNAEVFAVAAGEKERVLDM